jgi:hypothetical protein
MLKLVGHSAPCRLLYKLAGIQPHLKDYASQILRRLDPSKYKPAKQLHIVQSYGQFGHWPGKELVKY